MAFHTPDDIVCKLGFNYSRILSIDGRNDKNIEKLLKRLLAKKKEIDIRPIHECVISSKKLKKKISIKDMGGFLCDGYYTEEIPDELKNNSYDLSDYKIKNGKLYNVFSETNSSHLKRFITYNYSSFPK